MPYSAMVGSGSFAWTLKKSTLAHGWHLIRKSIPGRSPLSYRSPPSCTTGKTKSIRWLNKEGVGLLSSSSISTHHSYVLKYKAMLRRVELSLARRRESQILFSIPFEPTDAARIQFQQHPILSKLRAYALGWMSGTFRTTHNFLYDNS